MYVGQTNKNIYSRSLLEILNLSDGWNTFHASWWQRESAIVFYFRISRKYLKKYLMISPVSHESMDVEEMFSR